MLEVYILYTNTHTAYSYITGFLQSIEDSIVCEYKQTQYNNGWLKKTSDFRRWSINVSINNNENKGFMIIIFI